MQQPLQAALEAAAPPVGQLAPLAGASADSPASPCCQAPGQRCHLQQQQVGWARNTIKEHVILLPGVPGALMHEAPRVLLGPRGPGSGHPELCMTWDCAKVARMCAHLHSSRLATQAGAVQMCTHSCHLCCLCVQASCSAAGVGVAVPTHNPVAASLTLQRHLDGSSQELALLLMQLHSIADQQLQLLEPGRGAGHRGFDGQAVGQKSAQQGSYTTQQTRGLAIHAFMGRQSAGTLQGSTLQGCHLLRDRGVTQLDLLGAQRSSAQQHSGWSKCKVQRRRPSVLSWRAGGQPGALQSSSAWGQPAMGQGLKTLRSALLGSNLPEPCRPTAKLCFPAAMQCLVPYTCTWWQASPRVGLYVQ